jgi:hypothetical protein
MLNQLYDLADRFGLIENVAGAVRSRPGKAATKLAEVLAEVIKTMEALDAEMVRYLSLHFHEDDSIREGRAVLLGMEVGHSAIRINEARGHCHKIKRIYDEHLDKLFDRVFGKSSVERNQLRTIFDGLTTADDYMIAAMEAVSQWLESEAGVTLDHVDRGDLPGANDRIHQARASAKPPRKRLVETAAKLRNLQADFIESQAGVT